MKSMTVRAEASAEGTLELEIPCDVPPGPVEVVLSLNPLQAGNRIDWEGLSGLGREIWHGLDALDYVNDLRADREAAE